ncbi:MAG: double-strand break repair protein AddB, partial [Alphaproteobacteria bacterium]
MNDSPPKVFTIPHAMPFLDSVAAGILAEAASQSRAGKGDAALALARWRILVPTRRAVRALAEAFLRRSEGRALVLPRILPIGEVDEDELAHELGEGLGLSEAAGFAPGALPPAIPEQRRLLLLAQLVSKLGRAGAAIPPDQAVRLAQALAELLDRVQVERLGFARLAEIVPAEYAQHWQRTVEFLGIVTEHWPRVLAGEGALDGGARRNALIEAQAAAWRRAPPIDPVIAAGSTGSIPATAELLAVVARLPAGAVILPGLDRHADDRDWDSLGPTHPQFGLARLLARLGIGRGEVRDWPAPGLASGNPTRARLAAEVMRPPESSEAWRRIDGLASDCVRGLVRIDCPTPREEAGVVALLMRESLERPSETAALVTLDRGLARRVAAELRRWDIEIDDSAGAALGSTPPGAFLRLTAAAAGARLSPVPLLAMLKHPLAAGGRPPGVFRAEVRALERALLRGARPGEGMAGLDAAAAELDPAEAGWLRAWLGPLDAMASEFVDAIGGTSVALGAALSAHVRFAERLAATESESGPERLWVGEAGESAASFVAELADAAHDFPPIDGPEYPGLLDALLAGRVVRPRHGRHPRLHIWGPLEARLQHADLFILGGLNEGSWPREVAADPWMSRPMQASFGLPPPERLIGLSAHDFAQSLCARRVVLTRSERVEGDPTVPSRWLLRLEAVLRGAGMLDSLAASGAWGGGQWLGWQRALDQPERVRPCPRPEPRPPVSARPRRLRVTEIGTWLSDPYAVYARRVLRLAPLDPIDADPGAAERGTFVHKALDRLLKEHPDGLPAHALERLLAIGRETFGRALARPGVHAFWWPRFVRIARWFVEHEQGRSGRTLATEAQGSLVLEGAGDSFTLTASADRIDRRVDGSLSIIDYKTGRVPTAREVERGHEPQLPLEA